MAREKYSAFGERRRGESPLITDQLYTGQRYNVLSSLYHYSDGKSAGRFYDPLLGRFIQADPTAPPLPESVAQLEATSSNLPSFPNTPPTSAVRTAEVYPDRLASAWEDHTAPARGWVSQPTSATSCITLKDEKGFCSPETIPQAPSPKKIDPQQLNRFSYVRNNPLKYTDPTGYWTLSVSWGGTGFGIVGGRFSAIQVEIDNKGNVGVFSGVGGGGYGGFGGGLGPSIQVTGVPTIHDLRGWSVQFGLTGGELVGGTGEVVFMDKGVGFSLGGKVTALIPPAIVYGSAEHSWLWLEGNIWNLMPRPKEE